MLYDWCWRGEFEIEEMSKAVIFMFPQQTVMYSLYPLTSGCSNFVSLSKTPNTGLSASGKTRLDKERLAQCQAELVGLPIHNIFVLIYLGLFI